MNKFIFIFSVFLVSACEKNYTVEDFLKDNSLRNEYVKKCNNGELLKDNQNCINALKADFKKNFIDDNQGK